MTSIPNASRMRNVATEENRKKRKKQKQEFLDEYSDELEDYLGIVVAKILKLSKEGRMQYREDQVEKHSGISKKYTNYIYEYLVENLIPYGYQVKRQYFTITICW